jgi:hypothetical protein
MMKVEGTVPYSADFVRGLRFEDGGDQFPEVFALETNFTQIAKLKGSDYVRV